MIQYRDYFICSTISEIIILYWLRPTILKFFFSLFKSILSLFMGLFKMDMFGVKLLIKELKKNWEFHLSCKGIS